MGDRSMGAHGHCGARSKALGHKKLKLGKQMFPTQNFTLSSNMPTTVHFKRQGHRGARSKALGHKKLKIGKQMFPTQNFTLSSNTPTTEHFKRHGHRGARSKAHGHKKLKTGKLMFPTQNFTLSSNMPTTVHKSYSTATISGKSYSIATKGGISMGSKGQFCNWDRTVGDEQWDRTVSSATGIGQWETNNGIERSVLQLESDCGRRTMGSDSGLKTATG